MKNWIRIDPNAKTFYTTKGDGPDWKLVKRRVTINTANDEVVENLIIKENTDDKLLHRLLPEGVNETKTILYYMKDKN